MKLRLPRIRFGLFTTLFAIFALIILILLTPIGEIIIHLTPESYHQAILKDVYEKKTLFENTGTLEKPLNANIILPVLGTQSGVCFEFEEGGITIGQKETAQKGKKIADITIIGMQGQSYNLHDVIVTASPEGKTIICQQLGRFYSTTSDQIIALTITPKKPFTPSRIFWISTIDIFSFRPHEYSRP